MKENTKMKNTYTKKVDTAELEQKVKSMYKDVALKPEGEYHFEMTLTVFLLLPSNHLQEWDIILIALI